MWSDLDQQEKEGKSGIDYQWVRFGSDCVRRHSSTGGGDVVPGLLTVVGQISRNLVPETVQQLLCNMIMDAYRTSGSNVIALYGLLCNLKNLL